jgi:hypothetical protein
MPNVPDFQEELTDLLTTALQGETGLLVRFGLPLEVPKEYERVYVTTESNYRLGGGEQYRVEEFACNFVVEVFRDGDDPAGANRRRWEIIDLIDTALMEDDFHGYQNHGLVLAVESVLSGYDKGYIARSTCSIGASEEV